MATDDFERDLRTGLTALAEPAPAMPDALIPAIRSTARRQRRRTAGSIAAAIVLFIVGIGTAWPALTRDDSPPVATAPAKPLNWPLRSSLAGQLDDAAVQRAWPGRSHIRPLYAGTFPDDRQVVIAEGQTAAGEARVAVLTGRAGAWQLRLDAPGFATEPRYLLAVMDPATPHADSFSTVVALAAPDAGAARVNDEYGRAVVFIRQDRATTGRLSADQMPHLQLYANPPRDTHDSGFTQLSLRQWAQTPGLSARVTLLVSDKPID